MRVFRQFQGEVRIAPSPRPRRPRTAGEGMSVSSGIMCLNGSVKLGAFL
jgi:hypothetical protein